MRAVCNAENNYGDKLIKTNARRIPCSPGSAQRSQEKYQSISSAGERNAHSIFAYPMRIPNGHRRGGCQKINFQLPRARDKLAHALTRIRCVGVPRCLFLFSSATPAVAPSFPRATLNRHPRSIPRTTTVTATTVREHHPAGCAARRAGRFCFPLFSGFSGVGRAGHTAVAATSVATAEWCVAQQVADYKNHSPARGRVEEKKEDREKKTRATSGGTP